MRIQKYKRRTEEYSDPNDENYLNMGTSIGKERRGRKEKQC
jgi:hypothetical protein